MAALGFTVDKTGVATMTIDNPAQNSLGLDLMASFSAAIQRISSRVNRRNRRGEF